MNADKHRYNQLFIKQKSPFLRISGETGFLHHELSTPHLLYCEEVCFGQTLQAGLLTSGSSYWLHLPLARRLRVVIATFVTDYSGGTVPFSSDF